MKWVLFWILLLPAIGGSERVLTSGSAEFDTHGACIDAVDRIRSIETTWKEDMPQFFTECFPSEPEGDTYGSCFDNHTGRDELLACIKKF